MNTTTTITALVNPEPITVAHKAITNQFAVKVIDLLSHNELVVNSYAISKGYSSRYEDCEFLIGNTKVMIRVSECV
jgi:hypothetical protein